MIRDCNTCQFEETSVRCLPCSACKEEDGDFTNWVPRVVPADLELRLQAGQDRMDCMEARLDALEADPRGAKLHGGPELPIMPPDPNRELGHLRGRLTDLVSENRVLATQRDELQREVSSLQDVCTIHRAAKRDQDQELGHLRGRVKELEVKNARLVAARDASQEEARALAVAASTVSQERNLLGACLHEAEEQLREARAKYTESEKVSARWRKRYQDLRSAVSSAVDVAEERQ
jgi:hypothetical protein